MTDNRWQEHMRQLPPGAVVTVKGFKSRARIERSLERPHAQNKWEGWYQLDKPLNGFLRYHRDELDLVKLP